MFNSVLYLSVGNFGMEFVERQYFALIGSTVADGVTSEETPVCKVL